MIIAQITDSHIFLPEPEGSNRLRDLELVVDEINALESPPELVIHTGDITHNGTIAEYVAARDRLNQLKMPFYVIPGNRDRRITMRQIFGDNIGPGNIEPFIQYSLDFENLRLIMLDTLDENDRLGAFCEKRLADFTDMLAANKSTPVAVFMHHPPYDVVEAPQPFQYDSRCTVEKIRNIVDGNRQLTGIFCGHSHRNTIGQIADIEASTLAAIAIDLRYGEFSPDRKDRPVFTVHKL